MVSWDGIGLEEFLSETPSMRLTGMNDEELVLEGTYEINAIVDGWNHIHDSFALKMVVNRRYPRVIPKVYETEGKIPPKSEHHINPDGSFCLGSELRVKDIASKFPGLDQFAQRLLIPFLYSVSHKIRYNSYPYGDLDHGHDGLYDDYQKMFNVDSKPAVKAVMKALGRRKREANKLPCPCGCDRRLGRCDYRYFLGRFRKLERRRWFRSHL